MHLVHVDEDDLPVADPGEQGEQLPDMGGSLLRLGLAQQLLDLLPRQVSLAQDAADGVAPAAQAERLRDPLLELLQRPAVAGQAVVSRLSRFRRSNDLVYLLLGKRGERPPVWR